MAYGDYYNPTNKSVSDGAIVYAEDINKINTAVDAGFDQVASDLDELAASIGDGGVASKDWATEEAGTRPDPILDLYSSRAYAAEAKGWASAAGTITEASTGIPLVGSSSAKTQAAAAAASALTASGHATTASNQAVSAAASASTASGHASTASGFATAASNSATSASGFATAASNSATSASGFATAASGYADDASDYATTASGYATDAANSRSRKNAIINGNFDIWQRGTSQTSSGYFSDDRWSNGNIGSTKTHSRQAFSLGQTEVPGNPKYFSRTIVSSVTGASNYCRKTQGIEGVHTFSGETVTVSFWAKADAVKNIAVCFEQYFGVGGSPSGVVQPAGTKVQLSTTWKKFIVTASIPSIDGKILGAAGDYLMLAFWFDAGTNFSARTDNLGQQSGTFDIAQVQLELGDTATDFERRMLEEERSFCFRYYQIIPLKGLAGVSYSPNGDTRARVALFQHMRAAPAISFSAVEPFSIIGNGYIGEVINVSLGIPTTISYTDVVIISSISNYANIAGIGSVVSWGNAYESFMLVDAEL